MKNYTKYLLAMLLFTGLIACEDFLEPIDENRLDFEFVSSDPASAEGLLLQGYSRLVDQYSFTEAATDDAVNNQLNNGLKRMVLGELNAQFNPTSRWNNYQNVFFLNRFLEIVDAAEIEWNRDEVISDLFNKRLKGEALALRALHHFYILQAHAGVGTSGQLLGVPYYTEFIEADGDFNLPRLPFRETVEAILNDFDESLTLLPTDYGLSESNLDPIYADFVGDSFLQYDVANGSRYNLRISGRIVKALKARVALFAASPGYLNDQDLYQMAIDNASEVLDLNGGLGGLNPNGVEFYISERNVDEAVFRGNIEGPNSGLERRMFPPSVNGRGEINPSENFVNAFPMLNGFPATQANGFDPQNPFANRDPRLEKFVVVNGSSFGGGTINTGFGGGIDRLDSIPERSTTTGYYLKKLLRPDVRINNDNTTVDQRNFDVYLRYTELFLIFAEAANEVGGPDVSFNGMSARNVIAAIRERAGITQPDLYLTNSITTQDDMRQLIRNERRLELSFEGHRFWDLRRWQAPLNETVRGNFFDGNNYIEIPSVEARNYPANANYLPIPNDEIFKFPAIEQNSGW
ncbi:RagB/SusD family nutrient uptake outer membrane protein [uncultured Polaribacter sp.]|uniref:RagB/SusD family nutrient uptake outer membrane protein n=1 Tax=uncultured Polaribacter sp. TaxID=174711 RepID=UPI0026182E25|nr:RagB/SusD family nutrient uptake outer membrane protein [uncultured Polaribacter sp.]